MNKKQITLLLGISLILLFPVLSFAQEEADPAKAAQNPLANVYSLPLQNNMNFGIGDYSKTSNTLNIQPVIPVTLSKSGWLLINRAILPFPQTTPDIYTENGESTTGMGDINYTAWFAPPVKSNLTWGFGLVSIWPTASNSKLGNGKISLGPSFVFVYSLPKLMAAAIVANWKSVGGDEARADVNTFYFQYILTYFLQNKWYLSTAPINLANWEAEKDQRWTIPVGGGVGKMFNVGKMPMDFQTQAFYNVVRPDLAPEWQWRVQLKLIFPKGKK
jgi:hypothetical protein